MRGRQLRQDDLARANIGDIVLLPAPFFCCHVFAAPVTHPQFSLWPITEQASQRRLALKLYDRHAQGRRAARSATYQRQARGPATMPVLCAWQHHNGVVVIEPYAQGCSLAAQMDDERRLSKTVSLQQTWARFLPLVQAVCDAHEAGILHNDIKPDNALFLVRTNDASSLRLMDFHLACPTASPSTGGAGTTSYLAPEVMRAQAHSEKSDIFSLGACLIEMWTGLTPYEGESEAQTAANLVGHQPQLDVQDIAAMLSMRQIGRADALGLARFAMSLCDAAEHKRPSAQEAHHLVRRLSRSLT